MRRLPGPLLATTPFKARPPRAFRSPRNAPWPPTTPVKTGLRSLSTTTDDADHQKPRSHPFRFETGVSLFAKRPPRPFPPPFLSPPSGSFSDPLSTHHRSRDRRARVDGQIILGQTNGDDAVFASDNFICANDGVGAWSTRPRGHAGLWSRLILHYWATAIQQDATNEGDRFNPNPVAYLQTAYEQTLKATSDPNDWQGTTTASGALLHYKTLDGSKQVPQVYVTNLGDCQVMILRPRHEKVVYKTKEQWHWFDCPRQLGTNSPDTPEKNAVMDVVEIQEGDVVLAMSDGVIDNLWEHEIIGSIQNSIQRWENGEGGGDRVEGDRTGGANGGMKLAAEELVAAAKKIATDPFAESPFMEHAIEEGLPTEGVEHVNTSPHNAKMRGKRSKQYRKLMNQYSLTWGFREPYQCLVDAEIVADTQKAKYDLLAGLERTLHGKVKPMITQCEIRKLYLRKSEPGMNHIIDFAKTLERRRCGHLPEDYPEPLSTMDCFKAVVDPKGTLVNKHRYCVASQSSDVRRMLREIPGVPQIYIKRSVMILEPMATDSQEIRAKEEKSKFRDGLIRPERKRKREDDEGEKEEEEDKGDAASADGKTEKKKAKKRGPKGPNPLAVKKAKKATDGEQKPKPSTTGEGGEGDATAKKKRKRRHKGNAEGATESSEAVPASASAEQADGSA
ncbi:rRNA-processing protein utp23 [Colletotrichum karsti]|uniref:U three protein 23 n=1 Tax=Colletotrichum karsti TaxID=1095194 RepID=A0A9P6LLD2_9PEZI|nr:rRNA-processing protein utp23 [Colletotrichum karsti]KAF9876452.1 rRNA-processing protein utp23 [Colletotrichum karsti]